MRESIIFTPQIFKGPTEHARLLWGSHELCLTFFWNEISLHILPADHYNGQGVFTREIQEIDSSCWIVQKWLWVLSFEPSIAIKSHTQIHVDHCLSQSSQLNSLFLNVLASAVLECLHQQLGPPGISHQHVNKCHHKNQNDLHLMSLHSLLFQEHHHCWGACVPVMFCSILGLDANSDSLLLLIGLT